MQQEKKSKTEEQLKNNVKNIQHQKEYKLFLERNIAETRDNIIRTELLESRMKLKEIEEKYKGAKEVETLMIKAVADQIIEFLKVESSKDDLYKLLNITV